MRIGNDCGELADHLELDRLKKTCTTHLGQLFRNQNQHQTKVDNSHFSTPHRRQLVGKWLSSRNDRHIWRRQFVRLCATRHAGCRVKPIDSHFETCRSVGAFTSSTFLEGPSFLFGKSFFLVKGMDGGALDWLALTTKKGKLFNCSFEGHFIDNWDSKCSPCSLQREAT